MNKKALSKIERPVATEEMIGLAKRSNERYITTAQIIDIDEEKILILNFFQKSQLSKKRTAAEFRTFISANDYITQVLTTDKVRWKTGSFRSMFGWFYQWWEPKTDYKLAFASDPDFDRTRQFIKTCLKPQKPDMQNAGEIWDELWKFQDKVMDERLMERRKKETDPIDKKMELVPQLPKGFEKWIKEVAMADKHYLVYLAAGGKKTTIGYCTHCKKLVGIDVMEIKPKNQKRGNCPNCGSSVTFISKGRFPRYQEDYKWVCLIQKVPTGIVARYFRVFQQIKRDEKYEEYSSKIELKRTFLEETDQGKVERDSYEWGVYKQRGDSRWCPSQGYQHNNEAVVYTENLPEVLDGTSYRYCALDLFQKKRGCTPIPVRDYLEEYPSHTFLEMFIKTGFISLTEEMITGHVHVNIDGKTPVDILGIPKNYIQILREIDGGEEELDLLKQCVADKVFPAAQDIKDFFERFDGNDELLGVVNNHMSIRKFINYVDKQVKSMPKHKEIPCSAAVWGYSRNYSKEERMRERYRNLAHDWLDYLSWCAQLKYNMTDMYVLLPPDFGKTHDRVMKEYQERKNELERKRMEAIERLVKETLENNKDIPAMEMETKDLMIILPKNGDEIRAEGRALHHCVGGYVERVAKGETMILFIRKKSAPDIPYYTLEYRNGKVIQCRGKSNCSMTSQVKAFVEVFEKKIKEQEKLEQTGKAAG